MFSGVGLGLFGHWDWIGRFNGYHVYLCLLENEASTKTEEGQEGKYFPRTNQSADVPRRSRISCPITLLSRSKRTVCVVSGVIEIRSKRRGIRYGIWISVGANCTGFEFDV